MPRLGRLTGIWAALIVAAGCHTVSDEGGKRALPLPLPEITRYSDYQPDRPFVPSRNGVAERSVFTAASGEGYAVEVRDLLISPRQQGADLAIAGGAVVEVRQGAGEATVGERKIELRPGTVFTVGEGEPLHVTARGEPLALRAWIAWAQ